MENQIKKKYEVWSLPAKWLWPLINDDFSRLTDNEVIEFREWLVNVPHLGDCCTWDEGDDWDDKDYFDFMFELAENNKG